MLLSPNLRGAVLISASMAGFTINDALVKVLFSSMNMGQVMFLRGIFATALVAVILAYSPGAKRVGLLLQPVVAIRALFEMGATISFLLALSHLPIANVSAVMQALPLVVTLGAAFFLSEPVGWRRWIAIIVGFAGVLIIVRPGFSGFSAWSLLALGAVVCSATRDLVTHRISSEIPTAYITTVTSIAITFCGGVLIVPMGGWSEVSMWALLLLGLAAVAMICAHQFIIASLRVGDISFIAPFRYTAFLWALLLGYLFFGDVPDFLMLLGAGIVVASGLYALYREHRVGTQRPIAESTGPGMAPDGL
ncbi:DMT family transporter [Chelativorans sp. Marseille-P2723]|uniref:DMT family transporter n=1 Tax=Chelativorans sp. Marseille-P2723 TaxID=2709133 RepID=UPI00156E0034|nr:DMT family transporter [Chelativorans sp. Marseille-P2723]